MWPSPRVLRDLLGLPSAAEIAERAALDGLAKVLDSLWTVRNDSVRLNAWIGEAKFKLECGDRIVRTLQRFGCGDIRCGAEMLILHPRLRSSDVEAAAMGLELSAIERVEARWFKAWKEVGA
jgi:hypothetical protein